MMIRRFTSAPKPASRVRAITCSALWLAVVADPQPEPHGVELGQVGGHLAGHDQVVGAQRVRRSGDRTPRRSRRRATPAARRPRGSAARPRARSPRRRAPHHADLEPGHVTGTGRLDDRRHRGVDGGGVQRVVPGDHLVQQGGVQHRTGAGSGLVQRGGHRHHAVAGGAAVGRLHPDRAGDRGGLADRAAGVGADGQRRLEGGQRGGRAAAGAARDPGRCPTGCGWVRTRSSRSRSPSRTRPGWSCRGSRCGVQQPPGDGRVVRRDPALEDLRAAGRRARRGR